MKECVVRMCIKLTAIVISFYINIPSFHCNFKVLATPGPKLLARTSKVSILVRVQVYSFSKEVTTTIYVITMLIHLRIRSFAGLLRLVMNIFRNFSSI